MVERSTCVDQVFYDGIGFSNKDECSSIVSQVPAGCFTGCGELGQHSHTGWYGNAVNVTSSQDIIGHPWAMHLPSNCWKATCAGDSRANPEAASMVCTVPPQPASTLAFSQVCPDGSVDYSGR